MELIAVTNSPFVMEIYSKTFERVGWITDPIYATFTPRFNAQGFGEVQLRADDPMLEFLLAEGARVRVTYRDAHLMSGPIRSPRAEAGASGVVTLQIQDDWRILTNTLGWISPAGGSFSSGKLEPISLSDAAQTWADQNPDGTALGYGYYVFPTTSGETVIASTESVIKHLVSVNAKTRLGRPVTVLPNLDRGGDARAAGRLPLVRFDPLDEALADLLSWSGLGLRLFQDPALPTINVDVWSPQSWPQVLTVESGILSNAEWEIDYPEATRAVVGGPGDLTARAFYGVNDTTGLEARFGDIIEVFRDATAAGIQWPSSVAAANKVAKYFLLRSEVPAVDKAAFRAYLAKAGADALTDGRITSGISVDLSETDSFYFGGASGFQLGDQMTLLVQGVTFADRITEVVLSWDARDGLSVRPQIGTRQKDPTDQIASAVMMIAQAVRRLSSNK